MKINWKLPAVNVDRPFNISPGTASFSSEAEPSSGEVYRYFAFIDSSKLAISMEKDGSIKKNLYNFTDPSQLWRIGRYIKHIHSISLSFFHFLTVNHVIIQITTETFMRCIIRNMEHI